MTPEDVTEEMIAFRALCVIEQIAAAWEGHDTPEGRAFGEVFKVAHHAVAPACRKNHPDWGKGTIVPAVRERTP